MASWSAIPALIVASLAFASDLSGTVARISDGDTLTIQTPSQRVTVRLEGIDAPELAQPYGPQSRATLEAFCPVGGPAKVDITGRDRYGRTLGWVVCGEWAANVLQVESGSAWAFGRYLPPDSPLHDLQRQAQGMRRGLWTAPDPEPPWAFRARSRPSPR